MNAWLPEGFGEKEAGQRADKAVAFVRRRAKTERQARTAVLGVMVAALAVAGLWSLGALNGVAKPQMAQAKPLEITVQKADDGVDLAWNGNSRSEYVVYRCTSPRFDVCSTAGVVKGTRWSDSGHAQARLVFYKVEPVAGSGS